MNNFDTFINESNPQVEFKVISDDKGYATDDEVWHLHKLDNIQKYELMKLLAKNGMLYNAKTFDATSDDMGTGDMTETDVEKKWKKVLIW